MLTPEQKRYILDNCDNKTASQMATHLQISPSSVTGCLKSYQIEPLTLKDIALNWLYINAKTHTRQEAFKALQVSEPSFDKYVKEAGVSFKSIVDVQLEAELRCDLEELFGEKKKRTDRVREAYNQTGSPYGFADKLRGLKIK